MGGRRIKPHVIAFVISCLAIYTAQGEAPKEVPKSHDARPMKPPTPSYPYMASLFGMNGYCEVRFDVDERGYSFNHFTSCTDYIFCFQSKKAVADVLFEPAIDNGKPRIRRDVLYPLEYRMEGTKPGSVDRTRIKPCRKVPIA